MHSSARLYSTFHAIGKFFYIHACLFFSLAMQSDDALYQAQRFIEDRNSSNLICMP